MNKETNQKKSIKDTIFEIYDKKYRLLLIIPFIVLLLAIAQIAYQVQTTGDFVKKDVSLKGGITVTVPYDKELSQDIERQISGKFPQNDITIRTLTGAGSVAGVIIEADIESSNAAERQKVIDAIGSALDVDLANTDYGLEIVGSSLGQSFFRESLVALSFAFLFMGIVVLIYFRSYIPSIAIILATLSDMIIALAVINIMDMKIGTAGIAAFLMLIGYGVDTNILLTVRVLKRKEGSVMDRVISSLKTGMTMTMVSIVSTVVVLMVAQSEVIRQIMIIMLAGLFADILFTWIQNVGILRIHLERKAKKGVLV